ncbi:MULTISPECIES: nitroreductase/quinone reductase family protein [unclassified Nocardiopsis]|uniref:nitroreductase/quinone reductase family protein n=1 Tax=unclassified Nocardiopsis TaxID=2649073 RepID=UPI0009E5AFD0|nr:MULTISPECIES: nitroreductase/quinone reductase family protein [unclassified Nocardiopsis]MBQ1079811.1 nitroreductase family deazaflavin-dependent oxidoreductase [Nocardiopsis sp. B62]
MSFDTPNGTRGVQMPPAEQMRQMNAGVIADIRAGGSGPEGMNALVLTTIGRRSGEERHTPVAYFPLGDGSYVIVASAAGSAKQPLWYRNLAAAPDRVRVVVAGAEFPVTAEELAGDERDRTWNQITTVSPAFAQYEQDTDRTIPVIRLRPVARAQG